MTVQKSAQLSPEWYKRERDVAEQEGEVPSCSCGSSTSQVISGKPFALSEPHVFICLW